MGSYRNAIGHFKTINNHKFLVMKYCFKVGLYKQGLLHDLSKYKWIEFSAGVKYYRGNVSPNGIQKLEEGYSKAWLHHKGRNRHHLEYWIDYGNNIEDGMVGMKIPTKYVVEMLIDRMAASKNYLKDKYTDGSALDYFSRGQEHYIIHSESKKLLKELLERLANNGEEDTIKYIKNVILKN